MKVRVKKNRLPAIMRKFEDGIDDGVKTFGTEMSDTLKTAVQAEWGSSRIERTIKDRSPFVWTAMISVGLNRDQGFYSRFLEWGTARDAARPAVGPAVHAFEPQLYAIMAKALKKAVGER